MQRQHKIISWAGDIRPTFTLTLAFTMVGDVPVRCLRKNVAVTTALAAFSPTQLVGLLSALHRLEEILIYGLGSLLSDRGRYATATVTCIVHLKTTCPSCSLGIRIHPAGVLY